MKIVIATSNAHKVQEFRAMLEPLGHSVVSAGEMGGMPPVDEDGSTFEENAAKKACQAALAFHCPVMADDSGLEVIALGGEPGVLSARYAGEGGNDGRNLAKLLGKHQGMEDRRARFVCAIALADAQGRLQGCVRGEVQGHMADAPRGKEGFGYDPAFVPQGYEQTFGELPPQVKNRLSHRARALEQAIRQFFPDAPRGAREGNRQEEA